MKKNYFNWLLVAVMTLLGSEAWAAETDGLFFYELTSDGTGYEVVANSENPYSGDLSIPNQFNRLPVTAIGDEAFMFCYNLTSIEIPSSVTSIGNRAFLECDGLTSIEIPSSVTSIGDYAFYSCNGLTSIEIPSSVTSIGNYAFCDCSGLTSIEIPSSVTSIGDGAFIGGSGGYIDYFVVNAVSPDLIQMGEDVFYGYEKYICLLVPASSLESYRQSSGWCKGFKCILPQFSEFTYNDIKYKLDKNCDAHIVKDDSYANLKVISIPDRAKLGEVDFRVTGIDDEAFAGCENVEMVRARADTPIAISEGVFSESIYKNSKLIVPNVGNYQSADGWKNFANILTDKLSDGTFAYQYSDDVKSLEVVANSEKQYSGNLVIPSQFNGLPVTAIGDKAFYYCDGLTSIEIPSSVTSIGEYAFQSCNNLTEVTLNEGLQTIGDEAFAYTAITEITIPSSVTSIGELAFALCKNLSKVTLNEGLQTIGYGAFYGTAITEITIPSSVVSIGGSAFYECNSLSTLTCMATSPATVNVDENAFGDRKSEVVLKVPATSYAAYCSYEGWTQGFKAIESLPVSDGTFCYVQRNGIEGYVVVANIEKPYSGDLEIPSQFEGKAVIGIGDGAFKDCASLTSLVIPSSVNSFGSEAFAACSALTDIAMDATSPADITVASDAFDRGNKIRLTVPDGYARKYDEANWRRYVADIAYYSFYKGLKYRFGSSSGAYLLKDASYADMSSIVLPDNHFETDYASYNFKGIEDGAFADCTKLKMVRAYATLPDGDVEHDTPAIAVTAAAFNDATYENAQLVVSNSELYKNHEVWGKFKNIVDADMSDGTLCYQLNDDATALRVVSNNDYDNQYSGSITVPATFNGLNVTAIGERAFETCISLDKVELPSSIKEIGQYAFYCCPQLTSLNIPDALTSIGNGALGMTGLSEIELPNTVTTIGKEAFVGSALLEKVTLPNALDAIQDGVFSGCNKLASIEIPSTVTSIGDEAFHSCSELTSIEIPSAVTSIGSSAFAYCSKLEQINLPEGIETIPSSCFTYTGLTSLGIPESVTEIESFAFNGCDKLASAVIGRGVKSIGYCAFDGCESLLTVYSLASVPPVLDEKAFVDRSESSYEARMRRAPGEGATLYVISSSSISDYENSDWAKYFGTIAAGLPLGVDSVETGDVTIEVVDGVITVNGVAEGTPVMIYSINGSLVSCKVNSEISLPAGIYIVKVGSKAVKVAVK